MRSKLAIPALAFACFLGATAIASAQTEPAQPAPGASNGTTHAERGMGKMKSGNKMKTSKMKPGTTTGMSSGSSKRGARAPNAAPGMDKDSAK